MKKLISSKLFFLDSKLNRSGRSEKIKFNLLKVQ
jgi:hypothetical protein